MRGVGTATAAITIVNALPTGVGCAIGIDLPVHVRVSMEEGRRTGPLAVTGRDASPVVVATVRAAVAAWVAPEIAHAQVEVESNIPPRVGLKSSSAVASAAGRAVASAGAATPTALDIARLSARASRAVGVSATGALDDALAGVQGGFVVTDNSADRPLLTQPGPVDLGVAVWVPAGEHPPSPSLRERFRAERAGSDVAVAHALAGAFWPAMAANSEIVERVLGYPYAPLRARFAREGAVGAGVSGLGPALAVVSPTDALDRVTALLPPDAGETLRLRFTPDPAPRPEVRR